MDLLLVVDLYELTSNGLAWRTRRLTSHEEATLRSVYGDALPYQHIRIDEYARLGPPQWHFCYVSFHTINSWGPMSDDILIHEAMHVWQYCHHGAAYIPRALAAQRTEMGYNYGGLGNLSEFPELKYYNYEQQADIVADAFRLRCGIRPRWSPRARRNDQALFQPFLLEIGMALPNAY